MTGYAATVTMQGNMGQGGYDVWLRSRCAFMIKREISPKVSRVVLNTSQGEHIYYTDPNGYLSVELHNLFTAIFMSGEPRGTLWIELREMNDDLVDSLSIDFIINQGIGYDDVFAPRNKDWDWPTAKSPSVVLPPNVIIAPDYFPNAPTFPEQFGVFVESNYHEKDNDAQWSVTVGGVAAEITPVGNQLRFQTTVESLRVRTGAEMKVWRLDKPDTCQDLVVCRWTSLTGVVRQHFFPIVSYIKGNGEQVPLVSAGDGYEVSKSNFTAVRCRLTGLTQYGVWYYLDILQASDLHAIILPTIAQFRTEIASPMTAAFIDSDGGETSEGIGFHNFEFVINMRQYGKI